MSEPLFIVLAFVIGFTVMAAPALIAALVDLWQHGIRNDR